MFHCCAYATISHASDMPIAAMLTPPLSRRFRDALCHAADAIFFTLACRHFQLFFASLSFFRRRLH
jgi:hypothetical protein